MNVGGSAAPQGLDPGADGGLARRLSLGPVEGGLPDERGLDPIDARQDDQGRGGFEDRVLDEPAVPRLGEGDVGGAGVHRPPAVDDQDQQVRLDRGRDGARARRAVAGGLAVGAHREAGHLDEPGLLEPVEERLVDARGARAGPGPGSVRPRGLLQGRDQARLARIAAPATAIVSGPISSSNGWAARTARRVSRRYWSAPMTSRPL